MPPTQLTAGGLLERVRAICLAFPEATERLSHGAPTFFVRDKSTFLSAWIRGHHDRSAPHLWCALPRGEQGALLEEGDPRFFRPPYVGHRGWIGIRLDVDLDWALIADLCEEGYRAVAPKGLVARLDADTENRSRGAAAGALALEQLRALCATLPECTVDGTQHRTLRVGAKTIGWHGVDHHGDGRVALTVRAAKGDNADLVAGDPSTFFLPPYVAHHGYVGIYLDTEEVDWEEVGELVRDAYRLVAPKRLTKLLEPSVP